MSQVTYPVDAGTLLAGACPSTYQELADLLASIYSVTVNTNNTGIVVSATKPADTTVVWKQLGANLRPIRDYIYVEGLWLSRHTMEPGEIVLWKGSIASIWSFDGGDGNDPSTSPPTAISGAMWKVVSELSAKFPLGVGTLPSGTAVALGDTGGEEKHILTVAELARHNHPITAPATNTPSNGWGTIAGRNDTIGDKIYDETPNQGMSIATAGSDSPHNTMPPYYGIYFIERTSRNYFVVP